MLLWKGAAVLTTSTRLLITSLITNPGSVVLSVMCYLHVVVIILHPVYTFLGKSTL